jgi:hypothetical protein
MIKQGKYGSINVFINDLFISSFPVGDKFNLDYYKKKSNKALLKGMIDENIKLKTMCVVFKEILDNFYLIKKQNKRMRGEDHQLVFMAVLSLIKLNKIDEDDYLLICGRKKTKKLKVY